MDSKKENLAFSLTDNIAKINTSIRMSFSKIKEYVEVTHEQFLKELKDNDLNVADSCENPTIFFTTIDYPINCNCIDVVKNQYFNYTTVDGSFRVKELIVIDGKLYVKVINFDRNKQESIENVLSDLPIKVQMDFIKYFSNCLCC